MNKKPQENNPFGSRIFNLIPSRDTDRDWSVLDALGAGALGAAPVPLPAKVDLRKPWWKINDQEKTGSCVGWATADGLLRYHLVTANRLAKTELLSARFVWMGSKELDEFDSRPQSFVEEGGTSLKAAVDVIRKYGAALETEVPFKIDTLMFVGSENALYAGAATRRAASYFNLGKNPEEWKKWLAGNGPILAGLRVDSTWLNAAATGGKLEVFAPATVVGGHAVCIVGYEADHFIVRNSWGKTWGDQGFGYASSAYIAAAFFDEAYGISL